MLNALVRFALQFRVAVVAGAGLLIVYGVIVAARSPLDVFPEFAPPMVEIQTEAPGMSSETVEKRVTIELERWVNGTPGMTTMRARSAQGVSSIQLFFEPGTDIYKARQIVAERVDAAKSRLPEQVKAPRVLPPLSSTSRVLKVGLTSKRIAELQAKLDANELPPEERRKIEKEIESMLTELTVLAEWTIEPRLMAVPGVANISIWGVREKQYHVVVDPEDLRKNHISLQQVKQAAKGAAVHGSAGFLDTPNQRLPIEYSTAEDRALDKDQRILANLNQAVVVERPDRQGKPQQLLLNQVAHVQVGNPPLIGEGIVNDQLGLLLVIEKDPGANTLEVTRNLEDALRSLQPSLPPDVEVSSTIFRPATFIEQAIGNLRVAMIIGCILVALILVAFLFEWRTAVISLTAIPLSILTAVIVLNWLGGTLNTMVLAGLVIAVGEVVDDAIIDVENITRRLRLNRQSSNPRSAFRVVLDASLEVRTAVVYASFIVVLVCLPILFMGGVAGSFFRPLALAYILAILASLLVALTVTPALALMLLPKTAGRSHDSPLVRGIKAVYRRLLPLVLNRPVVALGSLVLLFVGAAVLYPQLKEEYLPKFQESDFLLHWIGKPGTGIQPMREDIRTVSKELRDEKVGVKQFGAHLARAEVGEEVVGSNFAELWISLGDDVEDHPAARRRIEAVTARHAGIEHDLLTYLQERIKEVLTGAGASIVIRLYGPDLPELREKAKQVKQAIESGPDGNLAPVPGVIELKVESQALVRQQEVVIDPARARSFGLTPGAIADNVTTLVNGSRVGEVLEDPKKDPKVFDVVVRGKPELCQSPEDLPKLPIDLPGGKGTIPLAAVADIRAVNAPNTIRHDKSFRCIDVTCNVRGWDLGGVAQEIQRRVQPLQKRPDYQGYRIEFMGEYQARAENQRRLYLLSLVALLGIALLLYLDFRSIMLTLLVMLTLPFALIGGVAACWLTGGLLSLGSLVGFITVLGIAARNGIMLVSHYRHLQLVEGVPFGRELILRGAEERVSPILMTALAAGLGLLPLAISGNKPGYEVEYPMAVVILGGLFTSTLLNLLILPVLYQWFGRGAAVAEEVDDSEIKDGRDGVLKADALS